MSMIDRRRNPMTASSSDHVPPSSGPRWRMSLREPSMSGTTAPASPLAARNPISPHTPTSIPGRSLDPSHDVAGRAVGRGLLADELLPAHAAPRHDIGTRGRVVGLHD